ncbi:MAG: Mth938-like domain-containing protein [Hyphomicrobiaceae bacterium]
MSENRELPPPSFPGQAPIDAYGNGGFRFADMSHRGSLICLPSQMTAWAVDDVDLLTPTEFALVFAETKPLELLLLGTGDRLVVPPEPVIEAFQTVGIGLEPMATGAAARTYNVLLAERRPVATALIAVA